MEFHGDTKTQSIRVAVPFSLRPAPKHETDFTLKNDFAILPVDMRLVKDLKVEIKQIQRDLAYLKSSPIPYGWYYVSHFALALPY
jgi:hypothetical protein